MTDAATASACAQRALFLSFSEPGPRAEIVSPYPQNTAAQLDMRRKVEILKYKQQTSNSNVATKAQKWKQVVRLSQKNPMSNKKTSCPSDALIPTLSSSCDIPGPIITLQYDPKVPLYKYGYFPERYNLVDPANNIDYTFFEVGDAEFPQGTSSPLCYLVLKNPTKTLYNYQFQMPISIYFSGYRSMSTSLSFINVTLFDLTCEIRFNNLVVPNVKPVIDKSNIINLLISVKDSIGYFEATSYVGLINVTNIILPAQSQDVYEFDMTFNIRYSLLNDDQQPITQPTNTISEIDHLIIGNITGPGDRYYNETTNCSIVDRIIPPYDSFQLADV
jgi:hypothetical protein